MTEKDHLDELLNNEREARTIFETKDFMDEYGVVRISQWPEGLVLWVGGEIRWKSWKPVPQPKDASP